MFDVFIRTVARKVVIPIIQRLRGPALHKVTLRLARFIAADDRTPPIGVHKTAREWIGDKRDVHYAEVFPSIAIQRPLPKTAESDVHWIFNKEQTHLTPPVFCVDIPDARVLGPHGFVVAPDHRVIADLSHEWFLAPEQHSLLFKWQLPPVRAVTGTTALLAVSSGGTYFHWMFDVLPRFKIISDAGIDLNSIDHFILNSSAGPFLEQSLELLGIPKEKRLFLGRNTHLRCRKLVAPSLPGSRGQTPPWAAQFLREKLLPVNGAKHAKRIYISRQRSRYRKIVNGADVRDMLLARGFEEFFLEELSFQEQVSLFAAASAVVAPHGAGLSNLVFCAPKTKVIEIFSPNYVNPCFWSLASLIDLEYFYALGAGSRPRALHDPHLVEQHISVDLQALKRTLKLAGLE